MRTKEDIEAELGGPIECIQLGPGDCLLVNAHAREQHLKKNKEASALWWQLHPESGLGADFILGPAIHLSTEEVAHLNLLAATLKPVLSPTQRIENAVARKTFTPAEVLQCSLDNPEACEACGS